MSKYKDELSTRIGAALGRDVSDVIGELYALGVIDDQLARKGCLNQAYLLTASDTSRSETAILSELADQYFVSEITAYRYVRRID